MTQRPIGGASRLSRLGIALLALAATGSLAVAAPNSLADRLMRIDRSTVWTPVGETPVLFATHHPQGMVRIGQDFFVSSVDIQRRTVRYPKPRDGHDRDAGSGVGHLFKIGADGALLGDLRLGEGDVYHPGGIDYDGQFIWVGVAEYRPNSRAIIYRVDPRTLTATEVLRVADHNGAVAYDRRRRTLHGVSWGGRLFYSWRLARGGGVSAPVVVANRSHYIDYQDCRHLGRASMLCSGLAEYQPAPPGAPFALGGWEIVDLKDHRPIWQAPILLWAASGRPMTQNPFCVEWTAVGVRAYFMPDDDRSTIYAYNAVLP